jgi:plastocyanin
MSTYRLCMLGALLLLGACSTTPDRRSPKPGPAVAARPVPVPSAMAAPMPRQIPEMPAPAPVAAPPVAPVAARSSPTVRPIRRTPPVRKAVADAKSAAAPAALQISGHVVLRGAHGQQVTSDEASETLVYFVPASGARARPGHFTVYTHNRDFSPEAMAVPQGSTVTFVNLDDVRHNVFSVTPGSAFDLGYQGSGEKAMHAFTRTGMVLISCNVHHSMELDLLVVPTPFAVRASADGSFHLHGLPAGPGTLHFWNPRAQPASLSITLPTDEPVAQALLAIRPRLTTELNAEARP